MALKVSETAIFTLASVGLHNAICDMVVDLGNQQTKFGVKQQTILGFELPDCLTDDGKPQTIREKLTMSLNPKSKLRPIVAGMRGRDFTAEEAKSFDLSVVICKACKLLIQHTQSDDGKTYAHISATAKPDKGQTTVLYNEPLVFDMDAPDEAVKAKLPEWIRKLIDAAVPASATQKPATTPVAPADFDDDLTF